MKRIGFVGATALALVACSFDAPQAQYQALEEQARLTANVTGQSAVCDLAGRAIEDRARTPPLGYSLDLLELYVTEHCLETRARGSLRRLAQAAAKSTTARVPAINGGPNE